MDLNSSESLLITSKPNIYYYSNIDDEFGAVFLLLTKRKKFVLTDARFIKGAAKIAKGFIPVATDKKSLDWWRRLIKKNRIKSIYFEPHGLTYYRLNKFRKMSRGLARLKPSNINLQELRGQKSRQEISKITRALRVSEQILREIITICGKRSSYGKISEQDLALEIHKQALARGCHQLAFPPIVAFGRNSGIPHHQPSKFRKLKRGDMILIDMGVKYQNYCSDITRTFFTSAPSSRQAEVYQKVLAAQTSSIKKIKAGTSVESLYNDVLNQFGRDASNFTHGLGHGIGLEIHEHPSLKPKKPDVLKSGHVITVEPGLYYNWGGVRIEDMVVVETNGCRRLTRFGKKLEQVVLK